MVKVTNTPEEVLDMSVENINFLKQQATRLRVEEVMRAIRILQEAEESSKLSKQARIYLELASIKLCKIEYDTSKEVLLTRINKLEELIKSGKIKVSASSSTSESAKSNTASVNSKSAQPKIVAEGTNGDISESNHNTHSTITIDDVKRAWKDIMEGFKARRAMVVYASLITGKPSSVEEGIVTIEYEEQYSFNKIRLEKIEVSKTVDEVFSEILRDKVRVRYKINKGDEEESKATEELLVDIIGDDILQVLDE
jgi:DNA polymerase-3 subunit gamma/tau